MRCPWGCFVMSAGQHAGLPEACLGTLPSSQTVNFSTAGMRSANRRTTAPRGLKSDPGSVAPFGEGCPHGDKYVRMEMRTHSACSSPNGHEPRRFVLLSTRLQTTARFLGGFKGIVVYPLFPFSITPRPLRRWDLATLSLGTVTGGSCSQPQTGCLVQTQKLTRP